MTKQPSLFDGDRRAVCNRVISLTDRWTFIRHHLGNGKLCDGSFLTPDEATKKAAKKAAEKAARKNKPAPEIGSPNPRRPYP